MGTKFMASNGLVKIEISILNLVRFVYFGSYQRRSLTAIR
jgi:hypothetical protein